MEFADVYTSVLKEYPDVLTPAEAATALGVSSKTMYLLLHEQKIKHIKLGRTYKIPKPHLLAYLHLVDQHYNPE